jgi:DNA-binding NarL/FixJ family response regulator
MSSGTVARLLSRIRELLPEIPVAVLSDFENSQTIREAFALGARGYIPSSLAALVAVEAVRPTSAHDGGCRPSGLRTADRRATEASSGSPRRACCRGRLSAQTPLLGACLVHLSARPRKVRRG